MSSNARDSIDSEPWRHPFLTAANIAKFREYSEDVWRYALEIASLNTGPLDCGFVVNMAQNMNKWAQMMARHEVISTLYVHPMDGYHGSHPYWEFFDGDLDTWNQLGEGIPDALFARTSQVPMRSIPLESSEFKEAANRFSQRSQTGFAQPDFFNLLRMCPNVRTESLLYYPEFAGYYDWACELSKHDVCYAASAPFSAYASGVPYAAFSVGGDLQIDCGKASAFGRAMAIAFASARFLLISNPHALGHSRRLGFTNGVYLPYPMDTDRYSPGYGQSRLEWEAQTGPGIFVLVTSRIDGAVKGFSEELIHQLLNLVHREPSLRLVVTKWGDDADSLSREIASAGLSNRVLLVPPVGKQRLIDYYRSCDLVLDQLVYGYYGATALEAASVGKPIVMFLRREQYNGLYKGDSAPVINTSATGVVSMLSQLIHQPETLRSIGESTRSWLVKNHGESTTAPLLRSLLWLTASQHPLPAELKNPLRVQISEDEEAYHTSCLVPEI